MSKDFGTLVEMGICNREQALGAHIDCNFYPPHPQYVKKSMIIGFTKYWNGEINLGGLQEACYLRDVDGLYRYFYEFLDLEEV